MRVGLGVVFGLLINCNFSFFCGYVWKEGFYGFAGEGLGYVGNAV